jgi:hypothetical protein
MFSSARVGAGFAVEKVERVVEDLECATSGGIVLSSPEGSLLVALDDIDLRCAYCA